MEEVMEAKEAAQNESEQVDKQVEADRNSSLIDNPDIRQAEGVVGEGGRAEDVV
jgi:hypothetical protein